MSVKQSLESRRAICCSSLTKETGSLECFSGCISKKNLQFLRTSIALLIVPVIGRWIKEKTTCYFSRNDKCTIIFAKNVKCFEENAPPLSYFHQIWILHEGNITARKYSRLTRCSIRDEVDAALQRAIDAHANKSTLKARKKQHVRFVEMKCLTYYTKKGYNKTWSSKILLYHS